MAEPSAAITNRTRNATEANGDRGWKPNLEARGGDPKPDEDESDERRGDPEQVVRVRTTQKVCEHQRPERGQPGDGTERGEPLPDYVRADKHEANDHRRRGRVHAANSQSRGPRGDILRP